MATNQEKVDDFWTILDFGKGEARHVQSVFTMILWISLGLKKRVHSTFGDRVCNKGISRS